VERTTLLSKTQLADPRLAARKRRVRRSVLLGAALRCSSIPSALSGFQDYPLQ
jgi:hypothetical protein